MSASDRWARLRAFTPARIGLERAGPSLSTKEIVLLAAAEAEARDAVWAPWDVAGAALALAAVGIEAVMTRSAARVRAEYLRRPDLGRVLAPGEAERLAAAAHGEEAALLLTNGLSSTAVERHGVAMISALRERLLAAGISISPVVLAGEGRVALGDAVGDAMGVRLVIVVIGERPGLSAADGLGLYLTFNPRPGTTDERRNCVSNVRPGGLPLAAAAAKASWLAAEALRRGLSGVSLKDESPVQLGPA
jgi:ethanolamine ammonia-lyase small subunit